jgi:hypothetical protein
MLSQGTTEFNNVTEGTITMSEKHIIWFITYAKSLLNWWKDTLQMQKVYSGGKNLIFH